MQVFLNPLGVTPKKQSEQYLKNNNNNNWFANVMQKEFQEILFFCLILCLFVWFFGTFSYFKIQITFAFYVIQQCVVDFGRIGKTPSF